MDPQARLTCEQLLKLDFVQGAGEERDKSERVARGRYGQRAQGRSRVRIKNVIVGFRHDVLQVLICFSVRQIK